MFDSSETMDLRVFLAAWTNHLQDATLEHRMISLTTRSSNPMPKNLIITHGSLIKNLDIGFHHGADLLLLDVRQACKLWC